MTAPSMKLKMAGTSLYFEEFRLSLAGAMSLLMHIDKEKSQQQLWMHLETTR